MRVQFSFRSFIICGSVLAHSLFNQFVQCVSVLENVWLTYSPLASSVTDGLTAWNSKQRKEQSEAPVWTHRKAGEPAEFGLTYRIRAGGGEWHLQHWHNWNICIRQEVRALGPSLHLCFTEIVCSLEGIHWAVVEKTDWPRGTWWPFKWSHL